MNKIGILAKISFLQDILSFLISKVNPLVVHNASKYMIIKKVFFQQLKKLKVIILNSGYCQDHHSVTQSDAQKVM